MEERVSSLEHAVGQLQAENERLRADVLNLREQLTEIRIHEAIGTPSEPRRFWNRWSVVVLAFALIAVPVLAFFVFHNAFWSTTIGAVNGLILYIIGPGVWRLLIEGLFRAIPGVLFGHATRMAVDNYRRRKAR